MVSRRNVHGSCTGENWKHALFVLDTFLLPLRAVSAGSCHTLAAAEGRVVSFGSDSHRQLGLGRTDEVLEEDARSRGNAYEVSPCTVGALVRPMLCFSCLSVPSVYCGSEGD
jgi:alpha-tubulin suppressor-like RCC1 family protein